MYTIYQKAFRNARFHLNHSLRSFAKLLRVSGAYLSRIENGKQEPSLKTIRMLERIMERSFWALVKGDFGPADRQQYTFFVNLNFEDMAVEFTELSTEDRSFLRNKFDVEIQELDENMKTAKAKFAARLAKSDLKEGELEELEDAL